jgi:hypothetical protein
MVSSINGDLWFTVSVCAHQTSLAVYVVLFAAAALRDLSQWSLPDAKQLPLMIGVHNKFPSLASKRIEGRSERAGANFAHVMYHAAAGLVAGNHGSIPGSVSTLLKLLYHVVCDFVFPLNHGMPSQAGCSELV